MQARQRIAAMPGRAGALCLRAINGQNGACAVGHAAKGQWKPLRNYLLRDLSDEAAIVSMPPRVVCCAEGRCRADVRGTSPRRLRYTRCMPLHFAYGTNMDRASMRLRCPGAYAIGTGMLSGWRLQVTVDGYVSIVRRQGGRVHGVLWRLTLRDLAALDAYEAVAAGLYRRRMLPVLAGGRRQSAQVYIGRGTVPGRPRPGHIALVLAAAREWSLPAAYIDEMRQWAGSGRMAARAPEIGEIR